LFILANENEFVSFLKMFGNKVLKIKLFYRDLFEGVLISLRAIKANKMRAILTTLGIIIGIVAVTTMSTAIVGLRDAFMNSISSLGSDVLYIDKYPWFAMGNWSQYRNRKNIDYDDFVRLKEDLQNYEAIAPTKRTFGKVVKYKERSATTTLVFGTNEDYVKTSGAIPEKGRFINAYESKAGRKVCVIGQDIADALFPNEDPLGKRVKIRGVPLKVVGVLEKQGSGFFGSFSLDGQLIMPLKTFESVVGKTRRALRIDVKVGSQANIEDVKEEIRALMRTYRKVPPGKPDDFAINQQEVFKEMYDKTVGIISIAGLVITALSLFVGAIGIMNIMFVSVTERTKEIGIRKAIGAKTWSILFQFLSEAAIICLIGGVIGIAVSFPLSLIINQFLPTAMPLDIVFIALGISFFVGIVSGFLPAYRASKLDPVDALRYE